MTIKSKNIKARRTAPFEHKKSNDLITIQDTKSDPHETNNYDFIKEITKSLPSGPNRGILWDIIGSIFEPGVNTGLMVAIHFSFLSLLAVHLWLIYLTEGREIHVWGLMALNLVLYPCLLVFISLAYKDVKVGIKNVKVACDKSNVISDRNEHE